MEPNADDRMRRRLAAELTAARSASDGVLARVAPDAFYERPIAERHRLIFYLGHLEAFDANLLRGLLELPAIEPGLDALFARGIDPVGPDPGQLPADMPSDWPRLSETRAYGRRCRAQVDAALASERASSHPWLAAGTAIEALIEHRLMHVETLAYLLHQLPLSLVRPVAPPPIAPSHDAPGRRTVEIPAGVATLGLGDGDGFGWDNERGEVAVHVLRFAIDAYPVTHGDFLAFVRAGGYRQRSLWSDDDWAWRDAADLQHPRSWRRDDAGAAGTDRWLLRALAAEVPLPLDHAVYVSHAEASAYARWRGARLPTEAEWHRAAYGAPGTDRERRFPWGDAAPTAERGNFDLARDDTTAVTAHPAGASAWGVHDLVGNGWEWTSTPFAPLPGFRPDPFYPGYSADFFDGRHFVLKGGSPRTAARLLRRSFRNWFQPHYPFVYATIRLVEA